METLPVSMVTPLNAITSFTNLMTVRIIILREAAWWQAGWQAGFGKHGNTLESTR